MLRYWHHWRRYPHRWFKRHRFGLGFLASLLIWLGIGILWHGSVGMPSRAQTPNQLVQQGVELYESGNVPAAIQQWQAALTSYRHSNLGNAAIILENLARAYQQLGQPSEAIRYWEQSVAVYRQLGNPPQIGRMLTEQAQALNQLGQPRQAIALLCGEAAGESAQTCGAGSAVELARAAADDSGTAAALGSLGEAYRLRGDYELAISWLKQSLEIAQAIQNPVYQSAALNSLGTTYTGLAQTHYRRANSAAQRGNSTEATQRQQDGIAADTQSITYFQQGLALAEQQVDHTNQLRALLGLIPAYTRTAQLEEAQNALHQAIERWEAVPDSSEKIYGAIDLATLLQAPPGQPPDQPLNRSHRCANATPDPQGLALLQQAADLAKRLGDRRAESFALGTIGHLYECQPNVAQALDITQQARWAAESAQAKDSLYLWEWQSGRLLKAQGQSEAAIAAYEKAVATLESIRSDLLIANRDVQFDFRDTIDPLYRELVTLRLELGQSPTAVDTPNQQVNVLQALKILDALKLAELQNYFGDDCIIVAPTQATVQQVGTGQNTAVINSVILSNRTAIIASFPNGTQQISWVDADQTTVNRTINEYRRELERFFARDLSQYVYSQRLYRWIIAPFTTALQQADIKTLVFVQDGILRSVPMAALYDATTQTFLVENYAIATTPSLTLTDANPLERKDLKALAIGLTQAAQVGDRSFPPLDNVAGEISAVATQLPGSKPLLDQEFTLARLREELEQTAYPIIHIATHGEFGTEPQDTFLVTGDNQKLTITQLDALLRSAKFRDRIELLALTACQTATGDDRAALGLAGVAVQAGAKSALASLWFIDDTATAKMSELFYRNLTNPSISKAEALQKAQIAVIRAGGETAMPAYWAPFILIGNWL